jgi:hypothetical protein
MNNPPFLTQVEKQRQYFLGLVLGLIPLIIFLVSFGLVTGTSGGFFIYGIIASAVLYVIEFIVTIVFLIIDRVRFVGYGLLTAFLVTPVVAVAGCLVIPNLLPRS